VLLACASGAAGPADDGGELPLRPYAGQLRTIQVEIDGRTATLIFDTGAGITSVTPEFARRIGCQPGAPITAFRMDGERVSFLRCESRRIRVAGISGNRDLGVFDLASVLPTDLPPTDGIAGLDLFDGRSITILPGLRAVRVENESTMQRSTMGVPAARLRLSREAGGVGLTAFAPVRTPAGIAWLLLDTANLAGLRLHPWVFDDLPGAESAERKTVVLSVEGAAAETVDAWRVDALIYDGALDADFLSRYSITLDLQRGRAWWQRAAADPT
jgi:hypothetical protein